MNPSNLSLRQKSRGTVVKPIAIHLYGARDPNYIVDLTCRTSSAHIRERTSLPVWVGRLGTKSSVPFRVRAGHKCRLRSCGHTVGFRVHGHIISRSPLPARVPTNLSPRLALSTDLSLNSCNCADWALPEREKDFTARPLTNNRRAFGM